MGDKSFVHNKRRNVGLTYEFLVRRVGKALLEKDRPALARSVSVLRKFFSPGEPLASELGLFDVVTRRGLSEPEARSVISELRRHAAEVDAATRSRRDVRKNLLLKEVSRAFGRGFWDEFRIPDYRAYASVHMLLERLGPSPRLLSEDTDRIRLEEVLVRHMVSIPPPPPPAPPTVDALSLALATKGFDGLYRQALLPEQREVVSRLLRSHSSRELADTRRWMSEGLSRSLSNISKFVADEDISRDDVMRERMGRVLSRVDETRGLSLEALAEELMLHQRLLAELSSRDI